MKISVPLQSLKVLLLCRKRGTVSTLQSVVLGKPCLGDKDNTPRLRMEAIMFSCQARNFLGFRLQDEHNASFIFDKGTQPMPHPWVPHKKAVCQEHKSQPKTSCLHRKAPIVRYHAAKIRISRDMTKEKGENVTERGRKRLQGKISIAHRGYESHKKHPTLNALYTLPAKPYIPYPQTSSRVGYNFVIVWAQIIHELPPWTAIIWIYDKFVTQFMVIRVIKEMIIGK